jgi:hypothetical protein
MQKAMSNRTDFTEDLAVRRLTIRRMTGRCSTGAERDGGVRYHAVDEETWRGWGKALCGAQPGPRGNGWSSTPGDEVTCPRCLKKLAV